MTRSLSNNLSITLLIVWAILCAVWNAYGSVQLSNGGHALGPTASLLGAGFTLLIGGVLILTFRKSKAAYRWLALVPGAIAALTIWNAFKLDPALWPSEFWRWAGILLNGVGVAGAVLAIIGPRLSRNDIAEV